MVNNKTLTLRVGNNIDEPRSGESLDGARGFGGREPPEKILPQMAVFLDFW